jgi:2TM domain
MAELLERIEETEIGAAATNGREQALASLNKKRDFRAHLLAFVLFNGFVWLIWGVVYAFGGPAFPWPIFPLVGWGIGLTFHAWDAYGRKPFREKEIEREAARLTR